MDEFALVALSIAAILYVPLAVYRQVGRYHAIRYGNHKPWRVRKMRYPDG